MKIYSLLGLTLLVGVLEIAGIATIVPFLQLASNPAAIENNDFVNRIYTYFGVNTFQSKLIFTGWCVLFFFLLSNIVNAISGWVIQKLGWQLSHSISIRLAETYLHQPFEKFVKRDVADIVKSTISDVNNVVNNVIIAGCRFISSIVVSILIIILLAIIQPKIAGISFLILASLFMSIFLFRKRSISNLGQEQLEQNSLRYISFVDLLYGKRTIHSSNAQDYFYHRFERPSQSYTSIQPNLYLNSSLPRYLIESVLFGAFIILIIFLAKDEQNISVYIPVISLYALAGYRLLPALNNAYLTATMVAGHHHAIHNIYDDLESVGKTREDDEANILFRHQIELENVSFRYNGDNDDIIKNISFQIKKGSNTAIIGISGSGKTTLGSMLVGLLQPTAGNILIDSQIRKSLHVKPWLDLVGHVPQDVFLFNGTVEENIYFGLQPDAEKLLWASSLAQAHGFITDRLSNQYQSIVGDSGIRLSGGQKQRIGLARAIYRQPEVLILDEATSALDNKTEKMILDAIFTQLVDTTCIVIAHRVNSVRDSDNILLVDNGNLIVSGTYNELTRKSLLFKELTSQI